MVIILFCCSVFRLQQKLGETILQFFVSGRDGENMPKDYPTKEQSMAKKKDEKTTLHLLPVNVQQM